MNEVFPLSEKYIDFLNHRCSAEFLEGTTSAGKTTVATPKFMFLIADDTSGKPSIIAGLDLGTIEKNIINADNGLMEVFGDYEEGGLIEYNPQGAGKIRMPHIVYHTDKGKRIIYILGYDDKARWKKALGGQYFGLFIDEFNIADMDFVREVFMRADYKLCTLNPDDPNKECYTQYVNKSRPIEKYKNDAPRELLNQLNLPQVADWTWWYFTFDNNLSLSKEKKQRIIESVPSGTKLYKNKILGLRGKATGLVFSNFDRKKHVITKEEAKKKKYIYYSAGLDTAYSQKSADTIAMTFMGITDKRELVILDERVYNNRELSNPIAPSDTVQNYIAFLDRNQKEWGLARNVFIDSADQATITELNKYKRMHPCIYIFNDAYKEVKIIDRINLQLGWLHTNQYLVVETCTNHIQELETYSWQEDKDNTPEDSNDHTINSCQYGWIPYRNKIGIEVIPNKENNVRFEDRFKR